MKIVCAIGSFLNMGWDGIDNNQKMVVNKCNLYLTLCYTGKQQWFVLRKGVETDQTEYLEKRRIKTRFTILNDMFKLFLFLSMSNYI